MSALAKVRRIPKPQARKDYRIALRPDHTGEIDDVVVCDVSMFRMERMDTGQWWLCCYFADSEDRITFGLSTQRGYIRGDVCEQPYGPAFTYEPGSMGAVSDQGSETNPE